MQNDRKLPPREAPEQSTAQLDADLIRVMDEMVARERAGTLGGQAAPLDVLQSPAFKSSETFRSWVLALTCLSPAIAATLLMLAGIIVPRDEGLAPLIAFALLQAMLLYAALFENPAPRRRIMQSAEIEYRKRRIEAHFVEIELRRRKVVWYCAMPVFAVLALTILVVR